MAGSYNHCVDDDGRLLNNERLVGMLENGGDVYEAVQEMYGMIWWLAEVLEISLPYEGSAAYVETARANYKDGLRRSPGIEDGYVEEGEDD